MSNWQISVLGVVLVFIAPTIQMFLLAWQRRRTESRSKLPFTELRRPAGEWLRVKVSELEEKFNEQLIFVILPPCLFAAMILMVRPKGIPGLAFVAPFVILSFVWTAFFYWKMSKTLRDLWSYRLGWDGERYVGEELTGLLSEGFFVFHDVPFKEFNTDHVIVGEQGVFSVETKTRRKPINKDGAKKYEVFFRGNSLNWGRGEEVADIQQAISISKNLSRWLSSATGESIPVTPILTLPGWWVVRERPCSNVQILNPREIAAYCRKRHLSLPPDTVARIRHQLAEKCKLEIT